MVNSLMKATPMILNSTKAGTSALTLFCLAVLLFVGCLPAAAQTTVTPKPKPETKQSAEQKPKVTVAPTPPKFPPRRAPVGPPRNVVLNDEPTPAEKALAVEPKVYVTLCVTEGNVKINGWTRDEVRTMVADGSQVGYKISDKNPKTGKPAWIYVLGYDPAKTKVLKPDECLSGTDIELDVPVGATVELKSVESETAIESVRKVKVTNVGGDIFLRNIAEGIEAQTFEGDVTVENSSGAIALETTGGNIVALDVNPSEIGDGFRAKTKSGIITLKGVGHRQIETNSISGSTSYAGEFLSGGRYLFGTQNGSIVLSLPAKETCARIVASTGFGTFDSELPLQNRLRQGRNETAQLGDCEANNASVSITSYSGRILLRKEQ